MVAGATVHIGGVKDVAAQRKIKEAPLDIDYLTSIKEHHSLMLSYRANVADNMKRLRKRDGLMQRDLAKLMGTRQGHIASLETSRRNFGVETLTRIAAAFNVEPASLLVPLRYADEVMAADTPKPQAEPAVLEQDAISPVAVTQPPQVLHLLQDLPSPLPKLLQGTMEVGISLTAVRKIAAATYKRIEALERRHGGIPMTREMLTNVLLAVLSASQNLDDEASGLD